MAEDLELCPFRLASGAEKFFPFHAWSVLRLDGRREAGNTVFDRVDDGVQGNIIIFAVDGARLTFADLRAGMPAGTKISSVDAPFHKMQKLPHCK